MDFYLEFQRILAADDPIHRLHRLISLDKYMCWYYTKKLKIRSKVKPVEFFRRVELLNLQYQRLIPNLWGELGDLRIAIKDKEIKLRDALVLYPAASITLYSDESLISSYITNVRCHLQDIMESKYELLSIGSSN